MENLVLEATKYTPLVSFDAKNGLLELQGESYPENTAEFYAPLFEWLKEYLNQEDTREVRVNLEIVYFNSSSSKVLMDIFDILEEKAEQGKKIQVNWIYDQENESALEYGEEFQEDMESVEFNLVVKKPD